MTVVTIGENTGDDFSGSDANNLYEFSATIVQSGDLDIGKYDTGHYRMGVLKFGGLSNLPGGLTVNSAKVRAYLVTRNTANAHTFTARRLLRNWVRAEATWNVWSTGNSWTTGGGQSNGNDRSSTTTGSSEGITEAGSYFDLIQNSAQLRTDVGDMVNSAGSNYGWHEERTDAANDLDYKVLGGTAATDGQRPYIEVDYTEASSSVDQFMAAMSASTPRAGKPVRVAASGLMPSNLLNR